MPEIMGGRRPRDGCGPGPFRETNKGPGPEGYQTMERSNFDFKRRQNGARLPTAARSQTTAAFNFIGLTFGIRVR